MNRIIWDPDNARANLETHGARFSGAEVALFDPNVITSAPLGKSGLQLFQLSELDDSVWQQARAAL